MLRAVSTNGLRIVLATMGPEEFSTLHTVCEASGHTPVAYLHCRSMRPRDAVSPHAVDAIGRIAQALPPTVDLLVPADPAGLRRSLLGYEPDLLVIYGFNWILPPEVFTLPRFGAINIHPSALPRYRGPAPLLWALRNGDPDIGVTVHRVDAGVDTGPILAQATGVPLAEDTTFARLRRDLLPVVGDVLAEALTKIVSGDPGRPQPVEGATRAPKLEPAYSHVDWAHPARDIHNQVRLHRFISSATAPVAQVDGRPLRLIRTSLTPAAGRRVECGDGPLWITEAVPADPVTDAVEVVPLSSRA